MLPHTHISHGRIVAVLFGAYFIVSILMLLYVPTVDLYPGYGIAFAIVYFGGTRLWPLLYAAALSLSPINLTPQTLVLVPTATALIAVSGAYLLRACGVDPLFRRYRDTFLFISIVLVVSCITPCLETLLYLAQSVPFSLLMLTYGYIATVFVNMTIVPFALRWGAKPYFWRNRNEILELLIVFSLLLAIEFGLVWVRGARTGGGVLLLYALIAPLFWIALRLRPRFVTLALLMTAITGVTGAVLHESADLLPRRLFEVESFVIALSAGFFVIVSQEEDRRSALNQMRSSVASFENALMRISSESQAKNDFIAILGHELRNPLAPIVATIDLLRLKHADDQEDMAMFDMMSERMSTVRQLLDDLLDIRRISEGKLTLSRSVIDLRTVIKSAMLSTEHYRKERHQSFTCKLPPSPLRVYGDAIRLEQMVSNLLTNASKYSRPGSFVQLVARTMANGRIEVRVIDEGAGLPKEALESIFMPFEQLDRSESSRKGLGIGLALVKSIVEMHGGTVRAESPGRGKGSTFVVEMPMESVRAKSTE